LNLEPYDAKRLANLCGQLNSHLKQIAKRLSVDIKNHGNLFQLTGNAQAVENARQLLHSLYDETGQHELTPEGVHLRLQSASLDDHQALRNPDGSSPVSIDTPVIRTKRLRVSPRGEHQRLYLDRMHAFDINFAIGPAGTGKTWLAVAAACDSLEHHAVERILLTRPAVEAGEKLGFLPGDLSEKVDPYLRPLYDALYEMLGLERVTRLLERQIIEVAPLAYMRGRTLNNSFVILDEAQNTTPEQMKMFLTRIGFGSHAVITGDITQVDLPRHQSSGLSHALEVLRDVDAIGVSYFDSGDIVRHPLVQDIVEAYERYENNNQ
jgi:phosphate starvation-inducible PhoH-like protein